MTQDFSAFKKKLTEYSSIPEDCWLEFASHLKVEEYKKGEHLVRAGDRPRTLYFIEKGFVRSYFVDPDGKEFIKAFFKDGEVAGPYTEMLLNEATQVSIEALEDLRVFSFDFFVLQKLYTKNIWFSEIGRKICEQYIIVKEQRIFEFLHFDAAERYKRFIADNPELIKRLPQYQIAAYLGISPVSLSRLLKKTTST